MFDNCDFSNLWIPLSIAAVLFGAAAMGATHPIEPPNQVITMNCGSSSIQYIPAQGNRIICADNKTIEKCDNLGCQKYEDK